MTHGPSGKPTGPDNPPKAFPPSSTPSVRASGIRTMVLVVVVVCSVGAVWFATRGGGDPSNTATPAVKFRKLPAACSFAPEQTVKRLVPGATTDHRPNERTETQVLAFCHWTSTDSHKLHDSKRASLDVRMSAYVGGPAISGNDQAKREMNDNRAKTMAGLDSHQYSGERFQDLTGPGDEAFSVYQDGAEIHVRVANVFFVLFYSTINGDAQALLQDARSAANDIVNALNSCTTCGH